MLFVDLASGQPKTKVQLLQEFKHLSLPASWTDVTLAALNVARVSRTAKPESNQFQIVVSDGVEEVDGVWQEKWVVSDMFSDRQKHVDADGNEVSSMGDDNYARTVTVTKAEQEADHQAMLDAEAGASVRAERDRLLKETDYHALVDFTLSEEMRSYRQALRDIPQQADFPNGVIWPDSP